jgi:hypothetical protein
MPITLHCTLPSWLLLGLVALAILVGPGGALSGGGPPMAEPPLPNGSALQLLLTTSELAVGANRLAFGLLKEHTLIEAADVVVRIYALEQQEARLQAEIPASYYPLELVEQGRQVHLHPDGSRHVHSEGPAVQGLYLAQVTFSHPGPWGLEVLATQHQGAPEVARLGVTVLAAPHTPAVGTHAPRSRNLIASDVRELRQIDSSEPPDPRLHQVRIADAIAQGTPQVIVFATPRFCTSRMCGPVVDIVRMMLPVYRGRVAFIHQEIWQDAAAHQFFSTVAEWRLASEPWVFIVDAEGIIRAKFEGLITVRELQVALEPLLAPKVTLPQ